MSLVDEALALKAADAPRCGFVKLKEMNPDLYDEMVAGIGVVSAEYLTLALNKRLVDDPRWVQPWSRNVIEVHKRGGCGCGFAVPK